MGFAEIDSVPLIALRGVILAGEELFDGVARLSSTHRRPTMVPMSIKVGRRCYELLDKTVQRNATWTSCGENLQATDNCQLRIIGRDRSVRQAERTRVRPSLLFCIMGFFLASQHMNSCTLALYTEFLDFILVFLTCILLLLLFIKTICQDSRTLISALEANAWLPPYTHSTHLVLLMIL